MKRIFEKFDKNDHEMCKLIWKYKGFLKS